MEKEVKTKVCTKCREEKELSAFGKHKISKDGFRGRCKECENYASKEYKELNYDKIKEHSKEYNRLNADKRKEYSKDYRKFNSDKIKEYSKKYYILNSDKISRKSKEYYKINDDKIKKRQKKYYKNIINSLNGIYIKKILLLQNFPSDLITPELIEAKRALIQLNRAIKQST